MRREIFDVERLTRAAAFLEEEIKRHPHESSAWKAEMRQTAEAMRQAYNLIWGLAA